MFDDISTKFVNKGLLPTEYIETVISFAESYISAESITNHRKQKYIFGGSLLLTLHNKTEKYIRPSKVSNELGERFSPSQITFSAYKVADYHDIDYQKPSSKNFAMKYASDLNCDNQVIEWIEQLYEDVGELAGKSNSGTGAALVYIASLLGNDKRTQKELSEVSGRSEVGIRNLYYEIVENSSLDVQL